MFLKRLLFAFPVIAAILLPYYAHGAESDVAFRDKIMKAISTLDGKVGIAVIGLDFKAEFSIKSTEHFPMQSVYKFPLALAVLDKIEKGAGPSYAMNIHIPRQNLDANTWSPMLKDYPEGDINMTLGTLLMYAISKSDNNACDVLFALFGGTAYTDKYIHGLGVKNIAIKATEAEMKKSWEVQYTNSSTPADMAQLLKLYYDNKVLTGAGKDSLMKWMEKSENSPKRIKGLLPGDAIVAHKTGTSNTNDHGVTAATNDIGIITLPNGRHLALVVFVSDYKGGVAKGESVIAEISKLIWDHYSAR